MLITPWIFIIFTASVVREFTFTCSLFVPKIKAIKLQVYVLQNVQKEIKASVWKKAKKLNPKIECPYLANSCCEFNNICYVAYPTWWAVIVQK